MTWFGISVTYIRFHTGFKKQGLDRSKLPYASALQPYAAWYAAIMCFVVCFVSFLTLLVMSSFTDTILVITVQRLGSLLEGPLGHCDLRYELPSSDALPRLVHRRQALAKGSYCQGRRHGLLLWSGRGRSCYVCSFPDPL